MLYNKVLDVRQHLGISRSDLAKATGLSERTIINLENGTATNITLRAVTRIARELKVKDYRRLFTYED